MVQWTLKTIVIQNTRAAYPINHIDNIVVPSKAAHPNTIIFLTADAFGVIPPISKLNKDQAMYHLEWFHFMISWYRAWCDRT